MRSARRLFSLRSKVILIIVFFHVILIFFFVIPMVASQHHIAEEQLKENYTERLRMVAHVLRRAEAEPGSSELDDLLATLAQDEFVKYFVIRDEQGQLLAGFDPDRLSSFSPPMPAQAAGVFQPTLTEKEPHPGGFFHLEGHIYDWALVTASSSGSVRSLNLGVISTTVNQAVADAAKRGFLISLAAICLGGVMAFWVDRKMRRSLGQLIDGASRMAAGDLSSQVTISTGDELEVLSSSFNRMADALKQREADLVRARETLEETVSQRTAELRASQQALVQHEKMVGIGQLAAGVAHELNTPITTIITSSQFLKEDIEESRCAADIERIRSEALRCKRIVHNLLEFSRTSDQTKEALDLNETIEKATALIRHEMELQNTALALERCARPLPVFGCENELIQVFFNLFKNSQDSMPNGGELKIALRINPGGYACVSVTDAGAGIPPDVQAKVFDPFFTTKEVGQGTGLGLSICYRIVQDHQGKIRLAKSDANGTTFEVILPLQPNDGNERAQ